MKKTKPLLLSLALGLSVSLALWALPWAYRYWTVAIQGGWIGIRI